MANNDETVFRPDQPAKHEVSEEQPQSDEKKKKWKKVTIGGLTAILLGAGAFKASTIFAASDLQDVSETDGGEAIGQTAIDAAQRSFEKALASARQISGAKGSFRFNGATYSTSTPEEWDQMSEAEQDEVAENAEAESVDEEILTDETTAEDTQDAENVEEEADSSESEELTDETNDTSDSVSDVGTQTEEHESLFGTILSGVVNKVTDKVTDKFGDVVDNVMDKVLGVGSSSADSDADSSEDVGLDDAVSTIIASGEGIEIEESDDVGDVGVVTALDDDTYDVASNTTSFDSETEEIMDADSDEAVDVDEEIMDAVSDEAVDVDEVVMTAVSEETVDVDEEVIDVVPEVEPVLVANDSAPTEVSDMTIDEFAQNAIHESDSSTMESPDITENTITDEPEALADSAGDDDMTMI
ncbi:MAG: hypothetical protein J6Y23_00905 [Prevotella sp.]|nr:hypothetical protein [Prevotella sp.]